MNLKNIRFRFTKKQIFNYLKYKLTKNKKIFLRYRPLWLSIYVSDICNLKCKMCPHHSNDENEFVYQKHLITDKMVSCETLEKIYKKFPEAYLVMFAGVGEPLTNMKFKELVELTSKYKKKFNIVTNGTLLNYELCKNLLSNKYLNQISISLNASNPKEYSEICNVQENKFFDVVKNIRTLVTLKKQLKSQAEIVVSGVCYNEFLDSSKQFLTFCDELGVDRIDLHRYIDFDIKNKLTDIDDFSEGLNELYSYKKKYIKTNVNLPHKISANSYKKRCEWFFKNLSFDSNGNIGSCGRVMSPSAEYGNIEDNNDIWNNKYMVEMRKKVLDASDEVSKYCLKCVENHVEAQNE